MLKRLLASLCAVACAVVIPAAAQASTVQGALTGRITYIGSSTLTIQTHGTSVGVITALTRTANAVAAGGWPYVWGGGHSEAGVASVGGRGPGYNGRRRGFDCSGSVAAVLSGAGLWVAGAGVPNDLGVVRELLAEGLIARGPGRAPNAVNLYDDPGMHIFMSIDGRFFGTSDGAGGNRQGGPTWLDDTAWDSYSHAFKRYHFLPSVLRNHTIYGHSYTFQTFAHPELVYGAELDDMVTVNYAQWPTGSMGIKALTYAGATTVTGTVSALTGSTLALQPASGPLLTFATSAVGPLLSGVQIGAVVTITYARDSAGLLVPHAVQITSPPPPANPANPTSPAAPTGTGPPPGPGSSASPTN